MSKSDYYLLYVLSRPPVPVPVSPRPSHSWTAGDVLSGQFEHPFPRERMLILDVNHDGQLMALRLSDEPKNDTRAVELVYRWPTELQGDGLDTAPVSQWIRLDKIWREYEIIPKQDIPDSLKFSGHLPQQGLDMVKDALLAFWLETGKTRSGLSLIEQGRQLRSVIATGYQLPRFLDFIALSFDETDYTLIREFLHLPKEDIKKPAPLDCNCEEHQAPRNFELPYTGVPNSFLKRTWAKLVECVKKLGLEREPSEILEELSKTAHCLKWQPGSSVAHAFVPKPCYIQQLPTELLLNIIETIPLHWERATLLNFGLTCKFFYQLVNVSLYTSIAISCKEEKWDKVVKMLPKHGHLTREIYLEAPLYDDGFLKRVVFDNLRAIGDYCPNLERLDLNYPMRLDMTATEADLPPKLIVEQQAVETQLEGTAPDDQEMEGNDHDGNTAQANHGEGEDNDHEQNDNTANIVVPNLSIDPERAEQQAARQVALEQAKVRQKSVCAELDYIIQKCPLLNNFSLQWTGDPALTRFYHKIPNLKGLRLWDRTITDQSLIATGTNCRELERFYFDGQDATRVTLIGLIGMLSALHTKKKSKLRRLGLYYPMPFRYRQIEDLEMDEFDDDDDEDEVLDEDDPDEMEEGEIDEEGNQAPPPPAVPPPVLPPAVHPPIDVSQSHLYKFLEGLSVKHPFLERLALIGCMITDDIIPLLGNFEHLQSLDLHRPVTRNANVQGLSAVGCTHLVEAFRGLSLSSLDLSGHPQISEDDMDILTGPEGLSTLRYIRVIGCPELNGKYLCDEWVHPDDFVNEGGTWRPRSGAGKGALEIGDGWKEQWGE